jgi:flagellar biosynthetic protein FliR
MLTELLMREALCFSLLFSRTTGFLLTTPFPPSDTPRTAKVGLSLGLAFFATMTLRDRPSGLAMDWSLVLPIGSELALGLSIGFVCRLVLSAAEAAGELVAQLSGLGAASLFNPQMGHQDSTISRMFTLLAMLLLLGTGSHRVVLAYLLESFSAVPLGAGFSPSSVVSLILDTVVAAIAIGVRLAMPVVAIALLLQVGLAIMARMAPSLQVFNIGFPLLIVASLLTLSLSLRDMSTVFVDYLKTMPSTYDRFFEQAAGGE